MQVKRYRPLHIMTVGLALASASFYSPELAGAHRASVYQRTYHPQSFTTQVYFDPSVPGGRVRSRILNGAGRWTRLGRQMVFVGHRRAKTFESPCPQAGQPQRGVVRWKSIDGPGGVAGRNLNCIYFDGPYKGRIGGFVQRYDSEENWYTRTGRVPSNAADLWSLASHEFGHATGRAGHYPRSSPLCAPDFLGRETMCPGVVRGQARQRTLGIHDKHTFKRVYGVR